MAKFCGKCGTSMEDNIAFCPSCGAAFEVAPAQPQSQAVPPVAPQQQAASPVATQAPPYQQAPQYQQPQYQQAPPYQQPQQPPYQQGAQYQQGQYQQVPPYQQGGHYQQGPVDPARDAYDNKLAAMLGYGLFFIPLLMAPNSRFAKFHANQGLLLNIYAAIIGILHIICSAIFKVHYFWYSYTSPVVHWIFGIIWLGYIAMVVIGAMNASKLTYKQLPVIGKFTLLK